MKSNKLFYTNTSFSGDTTYKLLTEGVKENRKATGNENVR